MFDQDDLNDYYREDVANCATVIKRMAFAAALFILMWLAS